jgi:hypothetical protein
MICGTPQKKSRAVVWGHIREGATMICGTAHEKISICRGDILGESYDDLRNFSREISISSADVFG